MPTTDDRWVDPEGRTRLLAKNVVMEYVAIGVNLAIGAVMLPLNVHYLGQAQYGLWVLVSSLNTYVSMLNLGYGSAQVKFTAQYRARRDVQALNEIASTLFFLFVGVALLTYGAVAVLSVDLGRVFKLTPQEVRTGRAVLLIISLYVAIGFPFSIFGAMVNGFQRYYLNNQIAIATSITVAAVNVAVLVGGYGLLSLVAATTAVRVGSFFFYRRTAYRAFPLLRVRWSHVRWARLKEVTQFSVFVLLMDLSGRINYSADVLVIGGSMGTAAIAVWSVAVRLVEVAYRLTGVVTRFLFPIVVDSAQHDHVDRLQLMLLEGTRLSLAMVVPMSATLAILAGPALHVWVGPRFAGAVPLVWLLSIVVATRIGTSTSSSILKGGERHRLLAWSSLTIAVSNLLLSLLFVRWWGLVGVALGTVTPVVIVSDIILFPAACRRVGVSVTTALRRAVWPSVWPMIIAGGLLAFVRPGVGASPVLIAAAAVGAVVVYLTLFIAAALGPEDRQWYLTKMQSVSRRTLPAAT
jgi:O-antigen/teichoic acid export membrane protein